MNIIDTIRVSGTDYTLSATSSGGITSGEVQTMIDESVSGITERMAEDEEVTAAALNNLNDRISGISGNNAVEVTQAEYDALVSGGTVDPTAFYIITDATPVDISNYWTSAQTNSAINAAVSGKQDTLSAGTGIDITNNVISAEGGGKAVTGGTNISVTTGTTADTINCTLPISATNSTNNIYTTSSYPFKGNSFKMYNVVFGINNKINSNGSSSFFSANLIFGRDNSIGTGKFSANSYDYNLVGGANNKIYDNYGVSYSNVLGYYNEIRNSNESAFGLFNTSNTGSTDADKTLFSVGNGTADNARHNAFEIRQNGDIYLTLNGQDVKLQDQLGGSSITVDSALSSTSENPVQNKVIYNKIDEVEQVTARALNALNDAISGKVDTSTFDTYSGNVETALSGKQDTLSAGTGIDITDNVISATGGGGVNVVQTTGTSTADVMSQDAVTTKLKTKLDAVRVDPKTPTSNYTQLNLYLEKNGGGSQSLFTYVKAINGKSITSQNNDNLEGFSLIETSAITTSVTSSSTDAQVPSAKAVYDMVGNINTILESI